MVTIVEPRATAQGCIAFSQAALQRSSRPNRSLGFPSSTQYNSMSRNAKTLYTAWYKYRAPLAAKFEKLESIFPRTLSAFNCFYPSTSKTRIILNSRRSPKHKLSTTSNQPAHITLVEPSTPCQSQDSKHPVSTMASQLRTSVSEKYADRDDLIYDYRHTFFDIFWTDKRYYPNTADEQLDDEIKAALKYIQGTREEITLMTATYPLDFEGLAELVQEARKVHQSLRFKVRRHYQAKEEGLRVPRESAFMKIEKESEHSSIRDLLKDSMRMLRIRIEDNAGKLNKVRDSRLNALDKAMERVEKQYKIAFYTEELAY